MGQTLASGHRVENRAQLVAAWETERARALEERTAGDSAAEWAHLERAHILSQPMAARHVRTHVAMLGCAVRRHDRREVTSQLFRLMVAGPGSWTGRYPVGNTGGGDVSAFLPMPIPKDLRHLLPNGS